MANPFPLDFELLNVLGNAGLFNIIGPFPPPPGRGQCTCFEGAAPAPFSDTTPAPISNIRIDQQWGVRFEWETTGPLNYLLTGNWELTCYLEQMGGGEFSLPGNVHTVPFVSAPNTYLHDFNFAPGIVPVGAYRLVTAVAMMGPSGYRGPISAIGEGPVMQYYKVGP